MSTDKVLMNGNVIVRASGVSYAVLWTPLVALGALPWRFALTGQRNAWVIVGILMLLGLIGTAWFIRMRLTLTPDCISYRGLLRTVRIPVQEITAIRGALIGRERS